MIYTVVGSFFLYRPLLYKYFSVNLYKEYRCLKLNELK